MLLYSKQTYYEFGNKAHTFLARRLKDRAVNAAPQALKQTDGALIYEPKAMADIFHDFFSKLYSLFEDNSGNEVQRQQQINSFLNSCSIPNSLSSSIDMEELSEVIKGLLSGKAPGPDGLTHLYLKKIFCLNWPPICSPYLTLFWRVRKFHILCPLHILLLSLNRAKIHPSVQTINQ